jgi:phenylacetaldehyde dehydrogenase
VASVTMHGVEPSVVDWLAGRRPMLIGGEAVDGADTLAVEDPATGEPLAEVAQAGPEEVRRAVARARVAFDDEGWRWSPGALRSRLILSAASILEDHAEELAQLEALEAGVPVTLSRAFLMATIETMEYAAGAATRVVGEALVPANLAGDRYQAQVLREPMGVIGTILPWNAPLSMAIEKSVFALATGNAVVLKPAEQTPLTALRLAELFAEAGLPPGVVSVVPGVGSVTGAALVADPGIDKVAFTGSTATGARIVADAAANLTPVTLELGGKSPNVVFADADLEAAVQAAPNDAFLLSGQMCTAPSRMFVERRVFDDFVSGFTAAAGKIALGRPLDPATIAGPLISSAQRERVLGHIDSGVNAGAVVACGGAAVEGPGYYVRPTILLDTTPEMVVEREEVFGPVVSVTPFDTVDEVIGRANDTSYGLAAGVWTNDLKIAHRVTRELQAGTVWINGYNVFDPALPFGGVKHSGWGREYGAGAVETCTRTRTVITTM